MLSIFAFIGIIHAAFGQACDQPIGVAAGTKGVVVDCSSNLSPAFQCQHIGLNSKSGSGSWCSADNQGLNFVEVALPSQYHVTKIATQGNEGSGEYVASFYVAYPDPLNSNRVLYILNSSRRPKLFSANSDGKTVVPNTISIKTKRIFILPQQTNPSIRACMRLEIYGCADATITDFCAQNNGGCQQVCKNSQSGAVCSCNAGFIPDGKNCKADFCATSNGGCQQICTNGPSAAICSCNPGFTQDGNKCNDIDECSAAVKPCDQICTNIPGSYRCSCKPGFKLVGTRTCEDIDECAQTPAVCDPASSTCKNNVGSYECICKKGYQKNAQTGKCDDINECLQSPPVCNSVSETCVNLPGSYRCDCKVGFTKNPKGVCVDIDECKQVPKVCDESVSTCVNTIGSYECPCKVGFKKALNGKCEDIDECKLPTPVCTNANTVCVNTFGSYLCNCKQGFRKLPDGTCEDIDECKQTPSPCDLTKSTCVNTPGSYECKCIKGYEKDAKGFCQDIDECARFPNICDTKTSTCVNLQGSYRCDCNAGYTKDSQGKCVARNCGQLTALTNGVVEPAICNQAQVPYPTKCTFKCNTGYKLTATSTTTAMCRADAQWDFETGKFAPRCESIIQRCPAIAAIPNSVILHIECTSKGAPVGQSCTVYCNGGFDVIGTQAIKCLATGQYDGTLTGTTCLASPTITCKVDSLILRLPVGQKDMLVKYTTFDTNVPKASVTSVPQGIVAGTARLGLGVHRVTLKATNQAAKKDECSFTVKIVDKEPPEVHNCNNSNIYINVIGTSGLASWSEPYFTDNVGVASKFSNIQNGQTLAANVYYVSYKASDASGNSANCNFFLHIRGQACQPDKFPGATGCQQFPSPNVGSYQIFVSKLPTQAFTDPLILSPFASYSCAHATGIWKLGTRTVTRMTDCVDAVDPTGGVCPANHELTANGLKCLKCAQGTAYDAATKKCKLCPIGKYQDQTGQATCKSCPTGTGTTFAGATSSASCSDTCLPGFFSADGFNRAGVGSCKKCPLGSYQPKVGQQNCELCPVSASTQQEGSKIIKDCVLATRIFKEVPRFRVINAKEGDTFEISCYAYGIPLPRMRFANATAQAPANVRGAQQTTLLSSQSPYIIGIKLTVTKATLADTVDYDCIAENNFGTAQNVDKTTFIVDVGV